MSKIQLNFLFITIVIFSIVKCQDTESEFDDSFDYDYLLQILNLGNQTEEENSQTSCHCVDQSRCKSATLSAEPPPSTTPSFLSLITPKSSICQLVSQVCCKPADIDCTCVHVEQANCADKFPNVVGICNQDQVCCSNVQKVPITVPTNVEEPGVKCGTTNVILKRVFNGQLANEREFPWFVAILAKNETYLFAGSLIHPQIVLTVAHRVDRYNRKAPDIIAKLGNSDLDSSANQVLSVKQIIIHPSFNSINLHNDLALLILDSPVQMFLGFSTICLPFMNEPYTKSDCISGGWGKDPSEFEEIGMRKEGNRLKYVKLPLVDNHACQDALRTRTRLGSRFVLGGSFLCAGGGNADTCLGDGGSPLVCPLVEEGNRYVQVGLTAWGIGCGVEGVPGVYASVENAISWISRIATQNFGIYAYRHFLV